MTQFVVNHLEERLANVGGSGLLDLQYELFTASACAATKFMFGQDFRSVMQRHLGSFEEGFRKTQIVFTDTLSVTPDSVPFDDKEYFDAMEAMMNELLQSSPEGTLGFQMRMLAEDPNEPHFTMEMARDNGLLDIAGPIAGANALFWAMMNVSRGRKDIFEKALHSAVNGDNRYLRQCIKESLRLFPTIFQNPSEAKEDIHIGEGSVICKGAKILVYSSCFRNADSTFCPERWEGNDDVLKRSAKDSETYYAPFGNGMHVCSGSAFMAQFLEFTLAHLLKEGFCWSPLVEEESVRNLHSLSPVLQTEGPVSAIFSPAKPLKQFMLSKQPTTNPTA